MIQKLFTEHPAAVNETYGEHFAMASRFGFSMVTAGLACMVHAIIPGLFITTGSDMVERLHDAMVLKRRNSICEKGPLVPSSAE